LTLLIVSSCGSGQRAAVPNGVANGTVPTPRPNPSGGGGSGSPLPGDPGTLNWTTGATADLTVSDVSVLQQYTGRPIHFPSGTPITLRLNVDLRNVSPDAQKLYGGAMRIAYSEPDYNGNHVYLEDLFDAGTSA